MLNTSKRGVQETGLGDASQQRSPARPGWWLAKSAWTRPALSRQERSRGIVRK